MPQLGRSPLLIILVVFLFLFILLPLLNRGKSKNLSDKERAQRTEQAMNRVAAAQKAYFVKNGSYTDHIADLIPLKQELSRDLSDGFAISLDTSQDRKTYLAQVASTVLALNRTVRKGKTVVDTCLALKGAGKDFCARDAPDKPITSTTPTTTTKT